MSVPFTDSLMMLACLPPGGSCPETVPRPIWPFEETT
jgi:hypothetical protein